MELHLIWAQARNGVIGRDNSIPWRLPEDMAHFKALTMGCPVIMGRKTWDSLPARFKPLPGRQNIVVTRQNNWHAEGAQIANSLPAALDLCGDATKAWIIGGAELYAQGLPLADAVEVTLIDADIDGDAYAPALGPQWLEVARQSQVSASGTAFSFLTYRKPESSRKGQ